MSYNNDALAFLFNQNITAVQGVIDKIDTEFKFGFNPDIGTSPELVWDEGGAYTYLSSASTLTFASGSTLDSTGSTGAHTVQFYGLDINYAEINETVTLTGQTGVTSNKQFLRIFRGVVRSAGTGDVNVGPIYAGTGALTTGKPANVKLKISATENQTLHAAWTVPAGKKAYLKRVCASSFTNAANFATVRLRVRPFGEVFQTKDKVIVSVGDVRIPYDLPIEFTEKSDIEMTAEADGTTMDVSASFEMIIITDP
jgi:hypothetical protein